MRPLERCFVRIPRWYHLLFASATYLISLLMIVVGAVIGLCMMADWIWHLGWGYPWWGAAFVVLYILIAFAINRASKAWLGRLRKSNSPPPVLTVNR